MSVAGSSHQPDHNTGKNMEDAMIRRAGSPTIPSSPIRNPHSGPRRLAFSPEQTPIDPSYSDTENKTENTRAGLRRRPSHQQPMRRHSGGDSDLRPSFSETRSSERRLFRSRDDGYQRDGDDHPYSRSQFDDYRPHPDMRERSRPPRSYRNPNDTWERQPGSASKPYFDEGRSDYKGSMDPDLERGTYSAGNSPRAKRPTMEKDAESIDGYNYDQHKKGYTTGRSTIDFRSLSKEEQKVVMRLPWTQWMNSDFKNHFVATIGEFVGTTMFLFFAFAGTQVANIKSSAATSSAGTANSTSGGATGFDVSVYLYISVIFGFSLMVNVWIFFRISGGLFNPAVTFGMVLVGAIPVPRAVCLFVAQIVGAITASAMVLGLFPTPLNVRTTLAGGASLVQGVFIEAILTAELVFTIFMLAKEKHKATFIAPVGIGLALFIAEMVGVYYTGGSLNPARSIGPCIVTGTFDKEHWIYWVGPFCGTLIAVFFYKFIKMLEYELANPGQDGDDTNDPTKNDAKRAELMRRREEKMELKLENLARSDSRAA